MQPAAAYDSGRRRQPDDQARFDPSVPGATAKSGVTLLCPLFPEVTTGVSGARAQKFVREFVEQTVLNEVRELAEKEGVNVLNKVNPISPANLASRIARHLRGVARKTFESVTKVLNIC